jgi:hypothetical protein
LEEPVITNERVQETTVVEVIAVTARAKSPHELTWQAVMVTGPAGVALYFDLQDPFDSLQVGEENFPAPLVDQLIATSEVEEATATVAVHVVLFPATICPGVHTTATGVVEVAEAVTVR